MMEHKTLSLAEQVFERLETDILSGVYQRGETLTELKLVGDLGVSRTPVREALHRLCSLCPPALRIFRDLTSLS